MTKQKYSDDELVNILEQEFRSGLGSPGSLISNERLRNLMFYKAKAEGQLAATEIADRSTFVATDVADTVEAELPSLIRVFAASHDAINCSAKKPQFKQSADIATEYVKYLFWKKNNGFQLLYDWFKDAMVQKVGFVKTYWDESKTDVEYNYQGLTIEQVSAILQDDDVEIINAESIPGDNLMEPETFNITVKVVEDRGCVKTECVPPEEMRISSRAKYNGVVPYICHAKPVAKQELEADGYDLEGVSDDIMLSTEVIERNEENKPFRLLAASTEELTFYTLYDEYIILDVDGDGIPEWRHIIRIGNKIFTNEKVEDHPFTFFCPNPMPHVFFGMCTADFALEPQKARTDLMRSIFDNVYLSVNQRNGVVDGQVNLDDLLESRPGGVVRMQQANSLFPIQQNGIDASAYQLVDWLEQWKEARTGFANNSQGLNADTLNPTATGALEMMARADARMELMARVAGESVRNLLSKMLKLIGQYQDYSEEVELMGEFTPVNPKDWHEQYQVEVNVGLGTGSKDKQAIAYSQLIQIQEKFIQGKVLHPQVAVLAARRLAQALGVTDEEELFPDASTPEPPPGPTKEQIEMEKIQSAERIKTAELRQEREKMILEIATGMIAGQYGRGVNTVDGTSLDQNAGSPGMTPEALQAALAHVNQLSAQMGLQ